MEYLKSLQALQHNFLDAAKQQLLRFGSAHPILVGCTHAGLVPPHLSGLETRVLLEKDPSPASEVLALLDLTMTGQSLFNTLCATAKTEAVKTALIEALRIRQEFAEKHDETLTEEELMHDIVKTICKIRGISEKDIQAMGMAWFLQKIEAHAAIFVSEAWMANTSASLEEVQTMARKGLKNSPEAKEVVLAQLETVNHTSMIASQLLRDPKDNNKITGFGEVQELINSEDSVTLGGRFTKLLKKGRLRIQLLFQMLCFDF